MLFIHYLLYLMLFLMTHGGLTNLGANVFSMAIAGLFAAFWIYRLTMKISGKQRLVIFLAAALADLLTYSRFHLLIGTF
ncbi:MAG: energy-coupling factor ABC transporter permease [Cyanobacteria bacterium J06632_19]